MAARSKRGFASMNIDMQRRIASQGGRAAHAKGTAHEFTPEEAREAGRKGGKAAHEKGAAHRFTSEEARAAGQKARRQSHHALEPQGAVMSQGPPMIPEEQRELGQREFPETLP
jgi:hypothetical protein